MSRGLKGLMLYYSNKISYNEVSKLVERISGNRLVCKQEIQNTVVESAGEISTKMNSETKLLLSNENLKQPKLDKSIDIYNTKEKEILLFCDAIEVKKQKESRSKNINKDTLDTKHSKQKTVSTNLIMLEKNDGKYEYITDLLEQKGNKNVTTSDLLKANIIKHHGNDTSELKIVAITDGAKNIKNLLSTTFEIPIFQILDWYHLCKKSVELLSMASVSKVEKSIHLSKIYTLLWVGKSLETIEYLKTINTKNQEKLKELLGYIEKHAAEIINYDLRQKCGKTIGSGRVEKGVDSIVGNRQKKKGMAWSLPGSHSLAILKANDINGYYYV